MSNSKLLFEELSEISPPWAFLQSWDFSFTFTNNRVSSHIYIDIIYIGLKTCLKIVRSTKYCLQLSIFEYDNKKHYFIF